MAQVNFYFLKNEKGAAVTEAADRVVNEERFRGIEKFDKNIEWLEMSVADYIGISRAVAATSAKAALRLAIRLAAERIAGSDGEAAKPDRGDPGETDPGERNMGETNPGEKEPGGRLRGCRVFCPDFASEETAAAICCEGGIPVLIDASPDDWGMDPEALETAFERYPEVRLVIYTHVYGFPGRIDAIKEICEAHGALLIEDASEALGAKYKGHYCGAFGDCGILDFEGAGMKGEDAGMNAGAAEGTAGSTGMEPGAVGSAGTDPVAAGNVGGMLLINGKDWEKSELSAEAGKLYAEEQSKSQMDPAETAGGQGSAQDPGYERTDAAAGEIRGLLKKLEEQLAGRIAAKKRIYERYADRLAKLDIWMNPYDEENAEPNFQTACMMISENGLSQARWEMKDGTWTYEYDDVHGRTCPPELYDVLRAFGAECRLAWRPLHRLPLYRNCDFVMAEGEQWDGESGCGIESGTRAGGISGISGEGEYLFERFLCLPSDAGMTEEEQERVAEMIGECFNEREWRADET